MDMEQVRNPRSKKWRVILSLYVGINGLGLVYAVAMGEGSHAAVHLALLMPLLARYFIRTVLPSITEQSAPVVDRSDDVLDRLERSVEGIALNLERIGEAQRFSAKVLAERSQTKL